MESKNIIASVKRIYRESDSSMSSIKSVCTKGCSFCCHQTIKVAAVEELLIVEYIKKYSERKTIQKLKANMNLWLDYFDSKTKSKNSLNDDDVLEFERQAVKDFIACPFLINQQCSIYPVRPLVCRTHIVNANPDECDTNRLRNPDPSAAEIQRIKLAELLKLGQVNYIRLLPYALAQFLVPGRRLKQIAIHGRRNH